MIRLDQYNVTFQGMKTYLRLRNMDIELTLVALVVNLAHIALKAKEKMGYAKFSMRIPLPTIYSEPSAKINI